MPDFRCYCGSDPLNSEQIVLSREESQHLVAANRARTGDLVRAFDGMGAEWDTFLVEADRHRAVLQIEKAYRLAPPPYTIALAQALPKGKLIENIIRKATEIGVQRLHPLQSSRVETKIDLKRAGAKNARWQAASIEGAKQSGNPFLLQIEPIVQLDAFLRAARDQYDLTLIASLTPNALPLKSQLLRFSQSNSGATPRSAVWLVGPEGDFTPDETDAAMNAGFLPTTLGPYVMRCETAAVSALSIIQHELS